MTDFINERGQLVEEIDKVRNDPDALSGDLDVLEYTLQLFDEYVATADDDSEPPSIEGAAREARDNELNKIDDIFSRYFGICYSW